MDLTGKVAVVTGSGRGLGLAYASELARRGAAVVINDVDAGVAQDAVSSIAADGGTAVAEVVPVGTSEAAQALVDRAVEEFGRLDILVNNAGILRDTTLWKMSDDDFDAVITTHLRGTFTCTRAAAITAPRAGRGRPDHLRRLPHRTGRQLRADQLRRGQGRDRRHGAHLGDGARARRRSPSTRSSRSPPRR